MVDDMISAIAIWIYEVITSQIGEKDIAQQSVRLEGFGVTSVPWHQGVKEASLSKRSV